jgi:hypothetical protein
METTAPPVGGAARLMMSHLHSLAWSQTMPRSVANLREATLALQRTHNVPKAQRSGSAVQLSPTKQGSSSSSITRLN